MKTEEIRSNFVPYGKRVLQKTKYVNGICFLKSVSSSSWNFFLAEMVVFQFDAIGLLPVLPGSCFFFFFLTF